MSRMIGLPEAAIQALPVDPLQGRCSDSAHNPTVAMNSRSLDEIIDQKRGWKDVHTLRLPGKPILFFSITASLIPWALNIFPIRACMNHGAFTTEE